ncbi:MAG TPA: thioesterase family protein [Bryobacteraceae bacterium]|nr:thioesterase family protein [Bryobacteraceae bacterium]
MSHRRELLAGFPVVVEIPILWGNQDAFGHVNNVIYFRWCETARVEYLKRVGLWVPLPPRGVGPILASVKCDYKRPLNYPDTVRVGARVTRIGKSSMQMEHRYVSDSLGIEVATADSTLVLLDYNTNKSVPVPPEMRRLIGELEGKKFE